jgi:multiple antibiotic resistance protein
MLNGFISTFVSLFVIIDPLGTAAVFAALTGSYDAARTRAIAIKAVIIAVGVLIGFSLLGKLLLEHMGISLAAFRTAGGLLLFVTAFRMIMGSHDGASLETKESYADRSNIAIFPLAIPLLAGPGCMTASVLHITKAPELADKALVLVAIVIVELLALLCMLTAGRVVRVLGAGGCSLLARLMGVLLAAMALQFIADGIIEFKNNAQF